MIGVAIPAVADVRRFKAVEEPCVCPLCDGPLPAMMRRDGVRGLTQSQALLVAVLRGRGATFKLIGRALGCEAATAREWLRRRTRRPVTRVGVADAAD